MLDIRRIHDRKLGAECLLPRATYCSAARAAFFTTAAKNLVRVKRFSGDMIPFESSHTRVYLIDKPTGVTCEQLAASHINWPHESAIKSPVLHKKIKIRAPSDYTPSSGEKARSLRAEWTSFSHTGIHALTPGAEHHSTPPSSRTSPNSKQIWNAGGVRVGKARPIDGASHAVSTAATLPILQVFCECAHPSAPHR